MKLKELIHHYELKAQSIQSQMPDYEKWGSGSYYRHRLQCYTEFLSLLHQLTDPDDPDWHDAEDHPLTNDYVILHFANCTVPMVGRYEGNDEDGGNYYIGDDDIPAIRDHMFVDAWMYLPECEV